LDARQRTIQDFVWLLRCKGVHLKMIAHRMGISVKTAEYHWNGVCKRFGTANQFTLALIAYRQRLIYFAAAPAT